MTFTSERGKIHAVDGVSLTLAAGRTLGLVGESGSGKTITSLAIIGLLPSEAWVERGSIRFVGRELHSLPARERQSLRGARIAMVFQEPMSALNPLLTVGAQIAEVLRRHRRHSARAARAAAIELLARVGMAAPEARFSAYPHELSGGMRQRALIAAAVAAGPALLLADEPTSALDVSVAAQILALLTDLQQDLGMAMLLVTHDLDVVARVAHEVAVMYAGQIVEQGPTEALLAEPRHPYTKMLVGASFERSTPGHLGLGDDDAPDIAGGGCRYRRRCRVAIARCAAAEPPLVPLAAGPKRRSVACFVANRC